MLSTITLKSTDALSASEGAATRSALLPLLPGTLVSAVDSFLLHPVGEMGEVMATISTAPSNGLGRFIPAEAEAGAGDDDNIAAVDCDWGEEGAAVAKEGDVWERRALILALPKRVE